MQQTEITLQISHSHPWFSQLANYAQQQFFAGTPHRECAELSMFGLAQKFTVKELRSIEHAWGETTITVVLSPVAKPVPYMTFDV